MDFQIAHAEEFPLELGRAPKKVRNAYKTSVVPSLRSSPDQHDPPRIKRLNGYKNLWRLRVSDDHRLVYRVDQKDRVVTMLMLDHRAKVYERLGADDKGEPGVRIVARAEELLEREPTPEEVGLAELALANEPYEPDPPAPERPLPDSLTPERLSSWGIPEKYHQHLQEAKTEGDFLELTRKGVPDKVIERVLNGLWPPTIEEVIQKPVRVASDPSEVEAAADGDRSLESFLLKLDGEQQDFLKRFEGDRPRGPWLLKGGPGSGKSTVALYCIRSLVHREKSKLPFDDKPLRILFTTFTKSLVNASNYLLGSLNVIGGNSQIDIENVDRLAFKYLPDQQKELKIPESTRAIILEALAECKKNNSQFTYNNRDATFLEDEIDWVIIGQGLGSVDEYLQADRGGRGRALGSQQRRQLWHFYEVFRRILGEKGLCLYSERLQLAAHLVTPQYDYVFIDEAQDLKPVGIRFIIGLCRERTNVFLTADINQSIYGNGLSWAKVASELRFSGRARNLRRNYRTTKEVWEAIKQLAPDADDVDRETLDVKTVFSGPWPVLARYISPQQQKERLNAFLHEALLMERLSPSCAAVLCPTRRERDEVVAMLDMRFNAKSMDPSEVDLSHPGVKVLTMHAAKGLQFPIVAVVGLEAGRMPWAAAEGIDVSEHNARQRRLLFVACSRAMRRLILFTHRNRPSPFVTELTDERWQIEDL